MFHSEQYCWLVFMLPLCCRILSSSPLFCHFMFFFDSHVSTACFFMTFILILTLISPPSLILRVLDLLMIIKCVCCRMLSPFLFITFQ